MTAATTAQWILLYGYMLLLLLAVLGGYKRPKSRPLMFAIGVLSFTHAVYYALFLVFPDVLDAKQTMIFSIAIRYQILFIAMLVWGIRIWRWRSRP